jgi:hypothetical protein
VYFTIITLTLITLKNCRFYTRHIPWQAITVHNLTSDYNESSWASWLYRKQYSWIISAPYTWHFLWSRGSKIIKNLISWWVTLAFKQTPYNLCSLNS